MIKVTSLFCNICQQTFNNFSKKKIFYHQKYHGYIIHKCDACDFIIDNSELLEFHIRKKHIEKTKLQKSQAVNIDLGQEKFCMLEKSWMLKIMPFDLIF